MTEPTLPVTKVYYGLGLFRNEFGVSCEMESLTLLSLPNEIIVMIALADAKAFALLAKTCAQFRNILSKLKIRLNGWTDGIKIYDCVRFSLEFPSEREWWVPTRYLRDKLCEYKYLNLNGECIFRKIVLPSRYIYVFTSYDTRVHLEYLTNGKLVRMMTKRDNKKHGKYITWWPNGKICHYKEYNEGERRGDEKKWYCDGVLKMETKWSKNRVQVGYRREYWYDGLAKKITANGES